MVTGGASCGAMRVVAICVSNWPVCFPSRPSFFFAQFGVRTLRGSVQEGWHFG
jgi:hypothetical protein